MVWEDGGREAASYPILPVSSAQAEMLEFVADRLADFMRSGLVSRQYRMTELSPDCLDPLLVPRSMYSTSAINQRSEQRDALAPIQKLAAWTEKRRRMTLRAAVHGWTPLDATASSSGK